MHMDRVFYHIISKIVGFPIGKPWLHSCSAHPIGKAPGMMISAIIIRRKCPLTVHCPSKFTAPNHKGIFQ
jgi:hypothetical protein